MESKNIIMGLVFVLVGIGLIIFGVKTIGTKKEQKAEYSQTIGTCIDYTSEKRKVKKSSSSSSGKKYKYETVYNITCQYIVDGKEYITKFTKDTQPNIEQEWTIYYNPNNPNECTLDVSNSSGLFMIGIGVLFSIVGTLAFAGKVKSI